MALRKKRKRNNLKRNLLFILGFIFLFSTGFVAGIKLLNKDISAGTSETLQANPAVTDNNNKNTESNNKTTTSDENNNKENSNNKNSSSTDKNGTSSSENTTVPGSDTKDNKPANNTKSEKEAFLTFDDGPTSKITPQILKILDEYDVKASFFVIGKNAEKYPDLIKEEKAKGHFIANHTYSHDYDYIYKNTGNFIKDLEKTSEVLSSILGKYDSKIIRFPGGSFGKKRAAYRDAVKNAGYTYIDWNALNGDAEAQNVPVATLIKNIKETTKGKKHIVILMHDAATKQTTVDALPEILEYLKSEGYVFKTIDQD